MCPVKASKYSAMVPPAVRATSRMLPDAPSTPGGPVLGKSDAWWGSASASHGSAATTAAVPLPARTFRSRIAIRSTQCTSVA